MAKHDPGSAQLAELVTELAAVVLPTDGQTEPGSISDAVDSLHDDTAAQWRLVKTLMRLVERARVLVGPPRRKTTEPRL